MNPVIIACKTIENEVYAAMSEMNCHYEIRWLESGLHNVPQKLNMHLQQILNECESFDTVLLAMGFCGNSLIGLHTGNFQMVVPRCDDCITLLLGSFDRRKAISATYFLTEGWLKGERNIWTEYEYCIKKYGKKRGKWCFDTMFAHYKNLALLDAGCSEKENIESTVQQIAEKLELDYIRLDGTLNYIKELLSGNWTSDRFVLIPPDSVIKSEHCTLKG